MCLLVAFLLFVSKNILGFSVEIIQHRIELTTVEINFLCSMILDDIRQLREDTMKEMTNLDTNVSKLTASTRDLFGLACSPKHVVRVVLRLKCKYYAFIRLFGPWLCIFFLKLEQNKSTYSFLTSFLLGCILPHILIG